MSDSTEDRTAPDGSAASQCSPGGGRQKVTFDGWLYVRPCERGVCVLQDGELYDLVAWIEHHCKHDANSAGVYVRGRVDLFTDQRSYDEPGKT